MFQFFQSQSGEAISDAEAVNIISKLIEQDAPEQQEQETPSMTTEAHTNVLISVNAWLDGLQSQEVQP